jgi:hypothetical protein
MPIILFDDSALYNNIGHFLAQPILCTIGNILGDFRCFIQYKVITWHGATILPQVVQGERF